MPKPQYHCPGDLLSSEDNEADAPWQPESLPDTLGHNTAIHETSPVQCKYIPVPAVHATPAEDNFQSSPVLPRFRKSAASIRPCVFPGIPAAGLRAAWT